MNTRPVQIARDPIHISVAMVQPTTANVVIGQAQPARISHPTAVSAAIGLYLLDMGLTGQETGHVRTLQGADFAMQNTRFTDAANRLTKVEATKLRKESRYGI